jgi:aryl-alcohol dehydrogenase-like predicted oxidoreductase
LSKVEVKNISVAPGRKRLRDGGRLALVIATKFFWPTGGGPNDHGAGRKHIIGALHASLRR